MKTFRKERPDLIMNQWCLFNERFLLWAYLRLFKGWKLQVYNYIDGSIDKVLVHERKKYV